MSALAGTGTRSGARNATDLLWLVWAIWLPYLYAPISSLLASHPSAPRLIITLVATACFVAVYLHTAWSFAASRALFTSPAPAASEQRWLPLAVLVFLSIALSLGAGKDWLQMFIYTSAIMGICLP
ncbi:MAG TPA: hypothetical protein VHB98_16950, partial [Chloroflexota bacterium]|nr:hypothetical protein [Chloroflexota bacterium]